MTLQSRQTWTDRLLAWGLGAVVAALAWFTGNNLEFPPELWDEVAVAAKIRPPVSETPLYWQWCLACLIEWFGVSPCIEGLKLAGPAAIGLLAVLVLRFFEGSLPTSVRDVMCRSSWGRWIARAIVLQCAVMFICSEPVWLAGRVLSPEMYALVLSMIVLELARRALCCGGVASLVMLGALSGFLAAETPLAIIPPLFCGFYLRLKDWDPASPNLPPLANPLLCMVGVRRMAWSFILVFAVSVAGNVSFFTANGGGGELDPNIFLATVRYFIDYANAVAGSVSPFGLFLVAVVVVLPLTIILAKIAELFDARKFLPIPYACFLALAGMLAFLQSTGFDGCRFWDWAHDPVRSRYLLCISLLGTSVTVLLSLSVFAFDMFFRNHERLAREEFPESVEDDPVAWRVMRTFRISTRLLRLPARLEPLLALALVVPFRFDCTVRDMAAIVNGSVRQTAVECGDAPILFTDGSLDAAVEVAAAMDGRKLKALSMMSRSGKYDTAVRLRGETNEECRTLLSIGAADALRTWVRGGHSCASNMALQVGLELWRHANLPIPEAGGFITRTAGFPDGEAQRHAASARRFGESIMSLHTDADPLKKGYPELNGYFLFTQWRISRMCRMRANEADAKKDSKRSEEEHALADALDRLNPEWTKVQEKMDWIGKQSGMRLTPREGLKLGLDRADFRLARSYARRVVASDTDDVQANFALGMGFFIEKQYGRAEMHLKKCLLRAPNEPAVLNNLAIVQLRLGRYAEAEANALKALDRLPDSSEIKTTLRHIRAARDGQRSN